MKTLIGITVMMLLLTHPATAQQRNKERISRDKSTRVEQKRSGSFQTRNVTTRKDTRKTHINRSGKKRSAAVQSRSGSQNHAYNAPRQSRRHSEMKPQNRSFKSKQYKSSRYQRKRSVKSHGHINHHYKNRKHTAINYHYYRRTPRTRLIYQPTWHTFYTHHFRVNQYRHYVNRPLRLFSGNTAQYHVGEIASVFGRVYETYYDEINQEFHMSFGAPYPRQDFTVVVTGREARRMNRIRPGYFIGQDFIVSGLITRYNGKPEVIVRYQNQIVKY